MIRFKAGALAPGLLLLVSTCGPAPAAEPAVSDGIVPIPVRQACDADGRCYETGDPGYRDDDAPPPRHRFDPGDDDRPPPPRPHYDPDDDRPPPPPRYRRYDPDEEPPPPPRRRYHRDDEGN